jgi:hypothetical protein
VDPGRGRGDRCLADPGKGFLVGVHVVRLSQLLHSASFSGGQHWDPRHRGSRRCDRVRPVGESQEPQLDAGLAAHRGQVRDLGAPVRPAALAVHQRRLCDHRDQPRRGWRCGLMRAGRHVSASSRHCPWGRPSRLGDVTAPPARTVRSVAIQSVRRFLVADLRCDVPRVDMSLNWRRPQRPAGPVPAAPCARPGRLASVAKSVDARYETSSPHPLTTEIREQAAAWPELALAAPGGGKYPRGNCHCDGRRPVARPLWKPVGRAPTKSKQSRQTSAVIAALQGTKTATFQPMRPPGTASACTERRQPHDGCTVSNRG